MFPESCVRRTISEAEAWGGGEQCVTSEIFGNSNGFRVSNCFFRDDYDGTTRPKAETKIFVHRRCSNLFHYCLVYAEFNKRHL